MLELPRPQPHHSPVDLLSEEWGVETQCVYTRRRYSRPERRVEGKPEMSSPPPFIVRYESLLTLIPLEKSSEIPEMKGFQLMKDLLVD